jgi:integrase
LRSSELRGLRWSDVDLKAAELHVRQRADGYAKIGKPKSDSGNHTIPLGPIVVNTLRDWRLACPMGELDLVFPNTLGKLWDHADIVSRYVWSTMVSAGVVDDKREAKYTGLHAPGTFMRPGSSTGKPTAGWNCLSRSCRSGSGIHRSS